MDETKLDINEIIYRILEKLDDQKCGILPITIAGKAVSGSFVGACAGTLAIAELINSSC